MKLGILILAAGQGTRMKSAMPKVLHEIAGKPMLAHVIERAQQLHPAKIVVVYGHGGEQVRQQLGNYEVEWALQEQQLGTGHAVMQGMPALDSVDKVLVLYGDVPLIQTDTLQQLIDASMETSIGMLTVQVDEPHGYGRIVRDEFDRIIRIVEHKDASADELTIDEINVGIMAMDRPELTAWLEALNNDNVQNEYYLTDVIDMAVNDGHVVASVQPHTPEEVEGINDRVQLAKMERFMQRQLVQQLMLQGVTMMDPERVDIRGAVNSGEDVTIDVNVILQGDVKIGRGVSIGANCALKNCSIGENVTILQNCVIEDAEIGSNCTIGPFARIRPGTVLNDGCHIGNFVELKNAQVDRGSKINHLSYVGDTTVGRDVNIGAGVITCNYDGAYKHRTVIGDNVFLGSDTQLVAPVTVESGATIGAGSTITRDAPANQLTLSRSKQITISGWKRPAKENS
ncbi:MAG: bifunctional UDP-N-acetylglucosamine diphosphorylase/glucosamine-1-phosphate N-acetyltransferase GlmU [Pseudomonadota bacterium]|nr:bifunctional UDP-N-acetylglucosamine diphosphorylase/glucosamine-1-phosphate N-acetyltransferase GlmU [Pseudomonadota bacterium]